MSNNITMFAGDTKLISVTVRDIHGDAVNLTGASITWKVARRSKDTVSLIEKSIGSGVTLVSATAGRFDIFSSSADTEELGGKEYYHEARVTLTDGTVAVVISGELTIMKSLH